MDQDIIDALQQFLQSPSDDAFTELRNAFIQSSTYDAYDTSDDDVFQLMDEGDFKGALGLLMSLMPNLFMSPQAHQIASFLHQELGDEEAARMEMALSHLLVEGISRTGDGTNARPYLVMRTRDEYDLLEYFDKKLETQSLVKADGKSFDVLTCSDGTELWFDVTDMFENLQRKMSGGQDTAEN